MNYDQLWPSDKRFIAVLHQREQNYYRRLVQFKRFTGIIVIMNVLVINNIYINE